MNIIILTPKDKTDENIYSLTDNRANHILNILKSNRKDIIEIGLLNGRKGNAEIIETDKGNVTLKILNLKEQKETKPHIDIICALPRPQTLKKILTTIATMGVSNLYLIRSSKVEKSFFQSTLLKKENYTKYLLEGLSQGKRTNLPNIFIYKRFKQFIENNFSNNVNGVVKLLADIESKKYLNKLKVENKEKYLIAIGPEGGWTEYETNFMKQNGFIDFKLSQNILRVETAITAALAQLELINFK